MKRDAIDLGTVNVFRLFRKIFIPTLLGMLSMSAVTAIDGAYVGHGIGSDGIAAINICIPLLMFFTGIGLMSGAGVSVVASIQLSRGKEKAAQLNVSQALLFVTVIGLAVSVPVIIWPSETGRFLGASESLLPLVKEYIVWFAPSLLFQMWCSVCMFIVRLDGAPKLSMMCNVIAALVTVVLGFFLIFPLDTGIKGAGIACSAGLLVGSLVGFVRIFCFPKILRPHKLKWSVKSFRLTLRNLGYQCRIGSSALLTEATMAMLMLVGNNVFMKYLGDNGVGAFGIVCYYMPFVYMVGNAIGQSAQPIISYNFGLGYRHRVSMTEKIALMTAIVCGVIVTAIFTFFPELLVGLFINTENPAAQIAVNGFPYFSLAYVFFILNLTIVGYYQSIEKVWPATILALLRGFIFLIPSFMLLPELMGTKGIWLALCLSELMTTAVAVVMYIWMHRTRIREKLAFSR